MGGCQSLEDDLKRKSFEGEYKKRPENLRRLKEATQKDRQDSWSTGRNFAKTRRAIKQEAHQFGLQKLPRRKPQRY